MLRSGCGRSLRRGPTSGLRRPIRLSPAPAFRLTLCGVSGRRRRHRWCRRGRPTFGWHRIVASDLGFPVAWTPMPAPVCLRRLTCRLGGPPRSGRRIRISGLVGVRRMVRLRCGLPRWRRDQRLLMHVDDRTVVVAPSGFLGPHRSNPVDPFAGALDLAIPVAVAATGLAFGLQRRSVTELRVEQDLQIGAQRGQLGPQRRNLIVRLGAQFAGQLPAQLGLHRQFILATRRDLPVQLQVVNELQVPRPGLIHVALPAIDHRDERSNHGGP